MLTLPKGYYVDLSFAPRDADGDLAAIDGAPLWTVGGSVPTAVELEPSDDGLTCRLLNRGGVGLAQVVVTGDADLGEGIEEVQGLLDVNATGGKAVKLDVVVGEVKPIEDEPVEEPPVEEPVEETPVDEEPVVEETPVDVTDETEEVEDVDDEEDTLAG